MNDLDSYTDLVQQALATGEWSAGALEVLHTEWMPRIRRFANSLDGMEASDLFQAAFEDLCLNPSKRAYAPIEMKQPSVWRRRVLQNYLVDQSRTGRVRNFAQFAYAEGLSPKMARRRRPSGFGQVPLSREHILRADSDFVGDFAEEQCASVRRHTVLQNCARLAPKRAVVMIYWLHGDVWAQAPRLAVDLKERLEDVQSRMAKAEPFVVVEPDHLPEPKIRVPWPHDALANAKENARKARDRGQQDLNKLLLAQGALSGVVAAKRSTD